VYPLAECEAEVVGHVVVVADGDPFLPLASGSTLRQWEMPFVPGAQLLSVRTVAEVVRAGDCRR
jgi:hypothetical protein